MPRRPSPNTSPTPKKTRAKASTRPRRKPGVPLTPEERLDAQDVFLATYITCGNVAKAAAAAAVHRSTIYEWQEHDEPFSFRFKQAQADYNDALRDEIDRRARRGVLKAVFGPNKKLGNVREYSDTLLIFQAKAHMSEYRDKQQVEISGQLDIPGLAAAADARFSAFLAAAAAATVLAEPDPGAEG